MSKATLVPKVTEMVETVIEPTKVIIELNRQEAVLLHFILGRCNSSPLADLYNDLDNIIKPKDTLYLKDFGVIDLYKFKDSIKDIPTDF